MLFGDNFGISTCRALTRGLRRLIAAALLAAVVFTGAAVGAQEAGDLPGLLRVTTSPATPAMISIDGIDRSQWGIDWLMLSPGIYEVCFGDAPGLVTPPCRLVGISAEVTTATVGEYLPQATLIVSAVSQAGQHLGSVISLDGSVTALGGVSLMRDPGPVQVCWGPVTDFSAPSCQVVILASGVTATVGGVFAVDPGALGPVEDTGLLRVLTRGAHPTTVLIDGQPATQWSIDWVPFPFGIYEVCFTTVPGWLTPPCASATIPAGGPGSETTTVGGLFSLSGTLRVTTSPPEDVVMSANGVPMNNWGLFTNAAAGPYVLCAQYPSGAVCDNAVVHGGSQTTKVFTRNGPTNWSPVAIAGPDQLIVVSPPATQAQVTFDGSASFDPDGTIQFYRWSENGFDIALSTAPIVTVDLGLGEHQIEFEVSDDLGDASSVSMTVIVELSPT